MKQTGNLFGLSFLIAFVGCDKKADHDERVHDVATTTSASAEVPHAHEELPHRIKLSPEVIKDAAIRTTPIRRATLAVTVSLPGEIAADPDHSARIASPAAGHVDAVYFKEGSTLKKGDVLAVIRVPELGKVRGAQSATLAKAKAARENALRLRALFDKRLTSEQSVIDAEAEAKALSAEAQALATELAALGAGAQDTSPFKLTLRAPIAGIVIARDAVVGQPVTTDHTLGSIADLQNVWFLGRVFEKDLGRMKIGAAAEVQLNAYPDMQFEGKVEHIGQQIDPIARTITARIILSNRNDLLRIGLFGMARVATGESEAHEPRLLVPRSAITEIGQKPVVFVKQNDGDFELHEIVMGDAALGNVEVVSGLREGEEVVVEGVFTLKSAVLKGTFGESE
jgi:cobalt-zinc-cadmium efflux system membrane fusion protein